MIKPLRVTAMRDSDDFMVAGTEDPAAAREAVYAWLRADDPLEEESEHRERADALTPRVGWYRWTPCHPNSCFDGGGHSGHLGYAAGPGRGIWRGVYLEGGW